MWMKERLEMGTIPFRSILFFFGMFLCVWRVFEPCLIYHSFGMTLSYPEFSKGWLFLQETLYSWGGPVVYVGAFLSQWFNYSWAGALIVTSLAWSFYRLTGSLVSLGQGRRGSILCYLPAIGLLMMYADYRHPLDVCLALLISLFSVVMYEKIPFRGIAFNGLAFVVFAVGTYFLAGGASLFFVVLAGLCDIVLRRRVYAGLALSGLGFMAICLVVVCFVDVPLEQAFYRLLPFDSDISRDLGRWALRIMFGMYIFSVLLVLWLGMRQRIGTRRVPGKRRLRGKSRASGNDAGGLRRVGSGMMRAVPSLVLGGMMVAAVAYSYDSHQRQSLRISRLARQEKWHDVLQVAGEMPVTAHNMYTNHDINRALFHVGRLGFDLFTYPQHPSSLMLMSGMQGQSTVRNLKGCDLLLELGDLNFAEQLAYEVLELLGNTPHVLHRLAQINLVKGQLETARVFLAVLSRDLIYGDDTEGTIQRLRNDPELKGDTVIERLRQYRLVENVVAMNDSEESLLLTLLVREKSNRMAFEYLMTHYLLTGHPEKVVGNIWRFRDLGYETIPRAFEEAIVLSMAMSAERPNLHGWTISPQTLQRYEAFNRAGRNPLYRGRGQAALQGVLARDFSDSYFFYYLFGLVRADE